MPPSDVAADEPPANGNIQEVAADERVIPTVQELCADDKLPANCTVHELGAGEEPPANGNIHEVAADERVIPTVQELGAGDEPPANSNIHELGAGDDPPADGNIHEVAADELGAGDGRPAIDRAPDLCAADAPQKGNGSTDMNNKVNHQNSVKDNNIEDLDQTFHGNVSEVEGYNVDFTETEASDGMLLDGIRKLSDERKQKRSVLKEQSRKRSRAQMGRINERLNKGRAAAYSRFSIGYFAKIVDIVCKSNSRMELVKNRGFGYLLEVDDCTVPRPFAQWVADNVNTTDEAIVLRGKTIPLNAEAVSLVLGIPAGSTPISTVDEEIGKLEFLSLFGLTEVPSISFFGNKLMTEDLTDDEYIRCFLTVALATFLCPTSNTKPSTKYMGALVDVSNLKNLNWCSFVHGWTMCYVKKYQQQKENEKEERITTTLGGCIYQLAVRCLDFNNFGAISIPTAMPRICFWKGQTVKHFSDMLIGKNGLYGALEIKDEAETCYAEKDGGWASTTKNSNIRKAIERTLGNSFPDNVKEDVFLKFQERMKDENLATCLIAKQVLLDTLHIISSSLNGSQDTLKLESSEDKYMPTNEGTGSGSTVRVDSNGIEINIDQNHGNKRTKRSSQESTSSTLHKTVVQDEIKELFPGVDATPIDKMDMPMIKQGPCNVELNEHKGICENGEAINLKCNIVEEPATKQPIIQIAGTPINTPELKTMDTDREIVESPHKRDINENNGPEKSSSLSYMLAANLASVLDQDINSRQGFNEHVAPSFSGFQDTVAAKEQTLRTSVADHPEDKKAPTPKCVQQGEHNLKGGDNKKHMDLGIDINLPPANDNNQSMQDLKGKGPQEFLHPLDIARQKYFFHDDSTPTFRIQEDVDDCGNEITEPELWRPSWMDSEAYNAKIENAKRKWTLSTSTQVIKGYSSQNGETLQEQFSVQCAQGEPTSRDFLQGINEKDGIIDLTSPDAHTSTTWDNAKTCYSPMDFSNNVVPESSSQQHKKIYSKTSIIGKRLFQDNFIEQDEHVGTRELPVPIADEVVLSPEVKILGERVFAQSCSNMVNTSDSLYNTSLSLGGSSSLRMKENLPPKRIVYPSKFLCSPYDNSDRGPLMQHELDLYKNILTLSKVEPHRSSWVVLIDKTMVSLGQLGDSFDEHGRVEAYVINVFCRILFRDDHPRHSKKHYFFSTVSEYFLEAWRNEKSRLSMRNRALVSFEGAGKALPLHESDRLFFPSIHQEHWFLFVVDMVAKKFVFLDSVYGEYSPYHLEIRDYNNFLNPCLVI